MMEHVFGMQRARVGERQTLHYLAIYDLLHIPECLVEEHRIDR